MAAAAWPSETPSGHERGRTSTEAAEAMLRGRSRRCWSRRRAARRCAQFAAETPKRDGAAIHAIQGIGAGATTTRVELEKIDRVVNMVGELVIAQAMLGQVVHSLPEDISGRLVQVLEEVVHHTRELKDSVMSMRAQQVGAVFQRMPRLVRELAAKTGKKARLEMVGENTEVDRSIIERLGDPLTHIIRNAVDHGIEKPEVARGCRQARRRNGAAFRRASRRTDRH